MCSRCFREQGSQKLRFQSTGTTVRAPRVHFAGIFCHLVEFCLVMLYVFADNIDTRTALEALKDIVTASNLYLRDTKPPNALLLHEVAVYITEMLTIFGTIFEKPRIGFPLASEKSIDVSIFKLDKIE